MWIMMLEPTTGSHLGEAISRGIGSIGSTAAFWVNQQDWFRVYVSDRNLIWQLSKNTEGWTQTFFVILIQLYEMQTRLDKQAPQRLKITLLFAHCDYLGTISKHPTN